MTQVLVMAGRVLAPALVHPGQGEVLATCRSAAKVCGFCLPPNSHAPRVCVCVRAGRQGAWQQAEQPHTQKGQHDPQGVSELILLSSSQSPGV